MVNVYQNDSPNEIWEVGDPLDFAWHRYADPDLKRQYAEAREQGRSAALRSLMELDVRDRLARGELIGVAFQTAPNLSDSQVSIPKSLFRAEEIKIDWDNSEIHGIGRCFESVRVARLLISANEDKPPIAIKAKKGHGGRTDNYPMARKVIEELYAEHGAYQSFSAARLLDRFNERYKATAAPPGERVAPVSERSLRSYIARYRQELAEAGKN